MVDKARRAQAAGASAVVIVDGGGPVQVLGQLFEALHGARPTAGEQEVQYPNASTAEQGA